MWLDICSTLASDRGVAKPNSLEHEGLASNFPDDEHHLSSKVLVSEDLHLIRDLDFIARDFICLTYLVIMSSSQEEHSSQHFLNEHSLPRQVTHTECLSCNKVLIHALQEGQVCQRVQVNIHQSIIHGHNPKA